MYDYFAREIELATQLGVQKIFIDAGLGFYYKNLQDSAIRIRFQMQSFLNSFRLRNLASQSVMHYPTCL
jgi:dihydropteroate synthase